LAKQDCRLVRNFEELNMGAKLKWQGEYPRLGKVMKERQKAVLPRSKSIWGKILGSWG